MRLQCGPTAAVISLSLFQWCVIASAAGGTSWDAPEWTTYEDALRVAQCQAQCLESFMELREEPATASDLSNEHLLPPACEKEPCRECFAGCLAGAGVNSSCETTCTTEQCKSGCLFFKETSAANTSAGRTSWNLSPPEIVCYRLEGARVNGVTLKWRLLEEASGGRPTSTRPLAAVFVTEMRTQDMAARDPQLWITLGTRYQGLIPVENLTDQRHQFRVTAVSKSGPLSPARRSPWTRYPENATVPVEPVNVAVSRSTPDGDSVVSRLTWSTSGQHPSCNYALDLLPDKWNVPSSHFLLSKPYDVFHYDMRGLSFDTNYTAILRSTDATEKVYSNPITLWFKTPTCLDCYQFNFSLCAPGPPSQLEVREVQQPTSTWVVPPARSVEIAWSPPAYASEENRLLGYQVTVEEERPLFDIQNAPAPRIRRSVSAETEELSLSELRDGARYRVLVQAQSPAGLGQPAVTQYHLHQNSRWSSVLVWSSCTCVLFIGAAVATASWRAVQLRLRRSKDIKWQTEECAGFPGVATDLLPPREFLQLNRRAFSHLRKSSDPFEVPFGALEVNEEIGRGAFSVVHKAHVWIGKVRETVAVKMLKEDPTPEERRNLLREMDLLKLVGQHANVVGLRAYCTVEPVLALVVEYCPLGDLRTYLIQKRAQLCKQNDRDGSEKDAHGLVPTSTTSADSGLAEDLGDRPLLPHLLPLARQVAQGMEFLSSKRVVHRDLAARNVLLVNEQHAKIADLGLSRDTYEEGLYRKQQATGRLPARWMALESLSHMTFTSMSDVWSFGVLMWEVATLGAVPYPGVANQQLLDLLATGYRLEKPAHCSQEAYDVMSSCWNASPICRPSFAEIVRRLDGILEQSQEYFSFGSESECSGCVQSHDAACGCYLEARTFEGRQPYSMGEWEAAE